MAYTDLTSPPTAAKAAARLLSAGILVAPLFYGIAFVQLVLRPEFDIRRLPLSYLALGDGGWIQVMSFAVTGLCAVLCAAGVRYLLRGQRGGVAGPLLIAVFGLGMIMAGVFPPDPAFGFPPGTPEGPPTSVSAGGALHMVAFFIAFIALTGSCFVFARRFASPRKRGWIVYCAGTGIAVPALVVAGMASPTGGSVIVAVAGLVLFSWLSALSAQLRSERPEVDR